MAPQLTSGFSQSGKLASFGWIRLSGEIERMRNLAIGLAILAAPALAGCSVGALNLGTTNYKGQPLSAVIAKLGSPEEQQTIAGQKTYTWVRGNALQECRIRVTMAGDVIDNYEGTGDVNICSQYGALSGGLKGYLD
jgi:hypothetical protein